MLEEIGGSGYFLKAFCELFPDEKNLVTKIFCLGKKSDVSLTHLLINVIQLIAAFEWMQGSR